MLKVLFICLFAPFMSYEQLKTENNKKVTVHVESTVHLSVCTVHVL